MRNYLTLLLFVVNCQVWGQFSDDFEDGDFTNSPNWGGQTANFIVNTGNATAQDVLALIEYTQKTVLERFGVNLERELKLVGDWS